MEERRTNEQIECVFQERNFRRGRQSALNNLDCSCTVHKTHRKTSCETDVEICCDLCYDLLQDLKERVSSSTLLILQEKLKYSTNFYLIPISLNARQFIP